MSYHRPIRNQYRPKTEKIRNVNAEAVVHRQVCDHIRINYPGVIFASDGSGNFLSKKQATEMAFLRSGRGYPDLFIATPRNGFHGLFLELKAEGTRIMLKNGSMTVDKHIREQAAILEKLRSENYYAEFAIGYKAAEGIIDWYLGLENPPIH